MPLPSLYWRNDLDELPVKIKPAGEIGESARTKVSEIFADGFGQWLHFFSKTTERLSRAFAHMFVLDAFFIAVIDGEIVGIAACTDGKTPSVRLNSKELRRHLGLVRGSIAGVVLKKEFENHRYPFPLESGTGLIEFVATGRKYRRKGVASSHTAHSVGYPLPQLCVGGCRYQYSCYQPLSQAWFQRILSHPSETQ